MKVLIGLLLRSFLCSILLIALALETARTAASESLAPHSLQSLTPRVFIPLVAVPPSTCPTASGSVYDAISFSGSAYKNNDLSDENADFRLSILGFTPNNNATLNYVNYGGGGSQDDGPRFSGMFTPHRKPAFVTAYRVNQWNWVQGVGSVPPYGSRGAPNNDWGGVTVLDVGTILGESLTIPERTNPNAPPDYRALVLYAGPSELTLAYMLQDQVVVNGFGYVVHMMNFCVDVNLLAKYRAQLNSAGKRLTMKLPAIRNNQRVGTAAGITMTIAIRDGARYMDPRGKTNWWYDLP